MLVQGVIDPDFSRDILESDIPKDVFKVLLLDRTTGKNILWMLLTIITLGIFGLWVPMKWIRWITSNIHHAA